MKVYLAGPITGLNFKNCTDWRQYAIEQLKPVVGISPMRCKEYLAAIDKISGHGKEYVHMSPLSTPKGVINRDRFDATRCDVVLVNLLGAQQVSIGTTMEIAWADLVRTPIILVMEKEGNPHEHMMINEAIGFRVETLDEGINLAKAILL